MEALRKFIGRLAMLVAVLTFVSCMLHGISLLTSLLRSAVVYLLALFLSVVMLFILRWSVWATAPINQQNKKESTNKEKSE